MKTKKLFLLLTFAFIAFIATGCFDVGSAKKLTFVQTPQSIYYVVGSDKAMEAQQEVLENVIVKVDDNEYTLKDLRDLLGATVEGLNLTEEGTHTLVIKYEGVTLTYVYKVVTDLGATLFNGGTGEKESPYKISTPQQFMNLMTRVYGIASPAKSSEETNENEAAWKTYYQACFPFYTTGLHYIIENDIDFTGVDFKTLGAFGGLNYIPFTGTINGNNKSLKNIHVEESGDYAAIFAGLTGANIYNLTLDNVTTGYGMKYSAGLAAASLPQIDWDSSSAGYKTDTANVLTNINLKNSSIVGFARVGGIVTRASLTTLDSCTTDINTVIVGLSETAGIVGQPIVTSKYSYKDLTFTYGSDAIKDKKATITISACVNNANIYANSIVNGIYGWNSHLSSINIPAPNTDNNAPKANAVPEQFDTVIYGINSTYSPVQGKKATSNRIFLLGNNDEVLGKTTKTPY